MMIKDKQQQLHKRLLGNVKLIKEGIKNCAVIMYITAFIFFFFWLRWVFVAARELSLVAVSGGYSSLWCASFSLWWLLLLRSTGSRVQAQQLWRTGLAAPQHVGSSRTRDRTRVPCTGKQILNHCTTREVPAQRIFTDGKQKFQAHQGGISLGYYPG